MRLLEQKICLIQRTETEWLNVVVMPKDEDDEEDVEAGEEIAEAFAIAITLAQLLEHDCWEE